MIQYEGAFDFVHCSARALASAAGSIWGDGGGLAAGGAAGLGAGGCGGLGAAMGGTMGGAAAGLMTAGGAPPIFATFGLGGIIGGAPPPRGGLRGRCGGGWLFIALCRVVSCV